MRLRRAFPHINCDDPIPRTFRLRAANDPAAHDGEHEELDDGPAI